MTKTVLITGAGGNIGAKLRAHFTTLGWTLRLLDVDAGGDPAIQQADLSVWDDAWVRAFAGVDAVIHLAGRPSPRTSWAEVQQYNLDLCLNVYEAAARQGAKRLVFASSNWTVAGHRFADFPLTTDVEPRPVNAYGVSKLVGERLGRSYHDRWGLSVICFRIGYCQRGANQPGAQMGWGSWGQLMWLSDRDLCTAMERSVAAEGIGFAVLNLMSNNPGMRWDIATTERVLGWTAQDGAAPTLTPDVVEGEDAARQTRALQTQLDTLDQTRRW
jgi:NAD(P)-dependent dehydrogenase (short-subunit alcohol dehydrogenase family)